jgi:hypothetical protein
MSTSNDERKELISQAVARILDLRERPDERTASDVAEWAARSPEHLYHLLTQSVLQDALCALPPDSEHSAK